MSDDRSELSANMCELVLALGERAATGAARPQPLHLADTVSDLTEETVDAALSLGPGHGESVSGVHETEVSCGSEFAESRE